MTQNCEWLSIYSLTIPFSTCWNQESVECDLVQIGEKIRNACDLLSGLIQSFFEGHGVRIYHDGITITQTLIPRGARIDIALPMAAMQSIFENGTDGLEQLATALDRHIKYFVIIYLPNSGTEAELEHQRIPLRTRQSLAKHHHRIEHALKKLCGSRIEFGSQSAAVPVQTSEAAVPQIAHSFSVSGEIEGTIVDVSVRRRLRLRTEYRTLDVYFPEDQWQDTCACFSSRDRYVFLLRGASTSPDASIADAVELDLIRIREAPTNGELFP